MTQRNVLIKGNKYPYWNIKRQKFGTQKRAQEKEEMWCYQSLEPRISHGSWNNSEDCLGTYVGKGGPRRIKSQSSTIQYFTLPTQKQVCRGAQEIELSILQSVYVRVNDQESKLSVNPHSCQLFKFPVMKLIPLLLFSYLSLTTLIGS